MQKPARFRMDPAAFPCDSRVDAMSTIELGRSVPVTLATRNLRHRIKAARSRR